MILNELKDERMANFIKGQIENLEDVLNKLMMDVNQNKNINKIFTLQCEIAGLKIREKRFRGEL